MDKLLTLKETEELLNVSKSTLQRWDNSCKLVALRTEGGHRRYRLSDIEKILGKGENGKIDALIELLHQANDEGHKILVFSQFTSVLQSIKRRLEIEDLKYCYLDGTLSHKKRTEEVDIFNKSNIPIFLISLKAGGTGLNLQSADVVIHFDPWWNPSVEAQASDRAHRIGQKNIVEVIKLISKDTVEEKVIKLQNEKK